MVQQPANRGEGIDLLAWTSERVGCLSGMYGLSMQTHPAFRNHWYMGVIWRPGDSFGKTGFQHCNEQGMEIIDILDESKVPAHGSVSSFDSSAALT